MEHSEKKESQMRIMNEIKSYELRVMSWKLTSQNSRIPSDANLAYVNVLSGLW